MRVLALDTAQAQAAVALWEGAPEDALWEGAPGDNGRVLAHRSLAMDRGQAEALLPLVADVMAEAGVGYDALDRIAATRGPGAFTGIRIGLAAARGLGLAAGVPVVGVATTAALAAAVPDAARAGRSVLVALDTKRGDFYVAVAGPDGVLGAAQVCAPENLDAVVAGPCLVIGDGAAAVLDHLQRHGADAIGAPVSALVDAVWVARLGAAADPADAAFAPDPLYLRPPAVNLPGIGRVG